MAESAGRLARPLSAIWKSSVPGACASGPKVRSSLAVMMTSRLRLGHPLILGRDDLSGGDFERGK